MTAHPLLTFLLNPSSRPPVTRVTLNRPPVTPWLPLPHRHPISERTRPLEVTQASPQLLSLQQEPPPLGLGVCPLQGALTPHLPHLSQEERACEAEPRAGGLEPRSPQEAESMMQGLWVALRGLGGWPGGQRDQRLAGAWHGAGLGGETSHPRSARGASSFRGSGLQPRMELDSGQGQPVALGRAAPRLLSQPALREETQQRDLS